ncbi:MAG: VOC family protein [Lachnospiraceae bacterium]|nr:VOC family protein [Lachnospiraceae bacterium]MDD3615610.1 VOC family protein [Lachnospiraceae bacterium]
MKLKNILIVVKDIQISKRFYKELFGLDIVTDFGENVILTEGLVLQEQNVWETFIKQTIQYGNHDAELYFEENDMDTFLERLDKSTWNISYVNKLMEHDWGQRVVRIYDPDNHVIEVGESLSYVARRFLKQGMSISDTAQKTQLPKDIVEEIAKAEEKGELPR